MKRPQLFVLLAALVAVLPLMYEGSSCGKDYNFHLQSWVDAASQFRHGTLYPRWTFHAAYNAGEPRFIFYPPISWMLGGVLTLLLPFNAVPIVETWIAFSIAGLTMLYLLRPYVSENAAFIGACVYIANPFMISATQGRNAYGEMFAAAFCPLLIAAMLRDRATAWSIGAPIALMWLSNVPGGIIATYLFLFLALLQLIYTGLQKRDRAENGRVYVLLRLAFVYVCGLAFGLALASFYLIPAMVQRPYILMSQAFAPHLRATDNLLLHRTLDPVLDEFLLRIEHIAFGLAIAIGCTLLLVFYRLHRSHPTHRGKRRWVAVVLIAVTSTALFLMTFVSAPLWKHLPALWVMQFPWRLLFVVGLCFAVFVALLFHDAGISRAWIIGGLVVTAALAFPTMHRFRYPCGRGDRPAAFKALLERNHSPEPADEYVLANADAGFMRPDNPPYWLANDPQAYAPGTTQNLAGIDPDGEMPSAPDNATLFATPLNFSIQTARQAFLIINLADFHSWHVTLNGKPPEHLPRIDGLIALAVPAGRSTIAIQWRHTWDDWVGACVTAFAIATRLLWVRFYSSTFGQHVEIQTAKAASTSF